MLPKSVHRNSLILYLADSEFMYLDEYDFSQFYEISVKQLLDEGLSEYAADEITKSVWEQLPNPNIRNCIQIGRLVKNEKMVHRH